MLASPSVKASEFDSWLSPLESPSFRARSSHHTTPQRSDISEKGSGLSGNVLGNAMLTGAAGMIDFDSTVDLINRVVLSSEEVLLSHSERNRDRLQKQIAKLDGECHGAVKMQCAKKKFTITGILEVVGDHIAKVRAEIESDMAERERAHGAFLQRVKSDGAVALHNLLKVCAAPSCKRNVCTECVYT